MLETGPKKDQLSEKSAMCDLVGLILALCPHYFVKEPLDDKFMYSLLEIQSVVLDKTQKKMLIHICIHLLLCKEYV